MTNNYRRCSDCGKRRVISGMTCDECMHISLNRKIKCELEETRNNLFARLTIPNYIFIVPPHRVVGLTSYTNENELKETIKKLLCDEVDKMEIFHNIVEDETY